MPEGPGLTNWKAATRKTLRLRSTDTELSAVDSSLERFEEFKTNRNALSLIEVVKKFEEKAKGKGDKSDFNAATDLRKWIDQQLSTMPAVFERAPDEKEQAGKSKNQELAEEAFKAVRLHFKQQGALKSSNKRIGARTDDKDPLRTPQHLNKAAASEARQAEAAHLMHALGLRNDVQVMENAKAGNCYEMAIRAKDVVLNKGGIGSVFCVDYAEITTKETDYTGNKQDVGSTKKPDHVFCVVGNVTNTAIGQRYPSNDMNNWPDELWIVDPWSTVCCKATEYY